MRYCKKCVMPDTRPGNDFDERGICQGCRAEEAKQKVDWNARWTELKKLCDKYRNKNGDWYDCVIAVSGGKDSHYQTYVMKELMHMNPLLATVEDNFPMTKAGIHNLRNLSEEFSVDMISFKTNIKIQKKLTKYCFEKYGKPTYSVDVLIYSYPIKVAMKFNIPLIVYGENIAFERGGYGAKETYSALEQFYNGVASGIPLEEFVENIDGLTMKDLQMYIYPSLESMKAMKLDPIYLSYFIKWNSYHNYIFAKSRGFRDLSQEWRRTHMFDDFIAVDSRAYLVHPWLKYPKFGHATASDWASQLIRYGLMTREEGIEMVKKYDHNLDQKCVDDFCEFCGYRLSEFWAIVDKFYNEKYFQKDIHGQWRLKNPIWEQNTK